MIKAIIHNLNRGVRLLNSIDDAQYSDVSVAPYNSSIGGHIRHILDIFDCIFDGLQTGEVNLAARKRNELAEQKTAFGLNYIQNTIEKLESLEQTDLNKIVAVKDDLGLGVITQNYTLGSALIQAHSHAIHHFASLGYLIHQLGINLPDVDFGYNPTTPRNQEINA
ncbi:MAG: DinB family protein [Flavobacteriaceae bacterium]